MIGKLILNYTIVSPIGKGGMGSVYLAEHKYIKQQKVAIKVINSDMVNDFTRQRLKEEAEHLASLNHQNIVRFQDYHIDESGNIYLIMEYADGISLDKYIETVSGLIVEEKVCPLFEPILDAVGYAHKHNIIHRDIKPANIIITKEGIPKILDFGIATIIQQNSVENSDVIMGTPSYMSPEQVRGELLDGRSDIYSLGVMLHQMLTGNAPYDITTLTEYDINKKVVEDPLPRMRTYYKYVSEKIQKIVDKATSKEKEERFQTCLDFKKALHCAIYPPKIPKWIQSVAAAILIVLIGSGIYWWDYNRTKVYFYKDYVEQWGVPQGIHELSSKEQRHRISSYKFVYQQRKLQRMSYINSKGSLITHNNTDDIDRPTDMQLFYQSDGRIDYVKVYNQSGKVLYVKDYSPELKVAVFKCDDEYGTEKNLSANTVTTFSSSMVDASSSRSKISRYLITYDDNGYVIRLDYAAFQNVRVGDNDGIFGKQYKLDKKGRPIEETYIGYDGNPKAVKSGMAIRTREFNEEDDPIRSMYLTSDRKPSGENGLKIPVCHNVVDKWGNIISQYYEDINGNLVLRSDLNIAGIVYEIENGEQMKLSVIGIDRERCYDSEDRISAITFQYDEKGYITSKKYADINDKPIAVNDAGYGYAGKNDENGNVLWYANLDEKGKPSLNSQGFAIVRFEYDQKGNLLERSFYNENDSLTGGNDNIAVEQYKYDDQGRLILYKFLDKYRKPAANTNGVVCCEQIYSAQGNLVQVSFYDQQEKRVLSHEGIAGWKSVYDDFGNEINRTFFDVTTRKAPVKYGYAEWKATYDDKGNRLDIHYLDKAGELCYTDEGYVGIKCEYDERGNMLSELMYGTDKRLAAGKLFVNYKYDNCDNEIEFMVFDINGNPALDKNNFHKKVFKYNIRNQCVEIRYYGVNGKLTEFKGDNYAIIKYAYNDRGDNTETSFYDVYGHPVCKRYENYAMHRSEYDNMGRVIRQTFFDENGRLTNPSKMVPEGLCKYDKWGNRCYLAAADGKGGLINNPATGWCIEKKEYNSHGDVLSVSYYDNRDKPICNNDGYHKDVYQYNSQNLLVRSMTLDINGKMINRKAGYSKMEMLYNQNKQPMSRKFYNANGELLGTQKWDGGNWTNMGDTSNIKPTVTRNNWQQEVRTFNSGLPLDFGDDAEHLVALSFKITGSNSCELIFKAPKSQYEMAEKDIADYANLVKKIVAKIKSDNLPSNVILRGILQDSKGRQLYSINR